MQRITVTLDPGLGIELPARLGEAAPQEVAHRLRAAGIAAQRRDPVTHPAARELLDAVLPAEPAEAR
jgi:hypothetical protein